MIYHIDTENMTVSQVFEYGKERGSDWYSDWISGVESLDGTKDHLWITAGSHLYSESEDRSDFYPKDMFAEGLTKTTHIDQVDNGELTFELTISGDSYNALTYVHSVCRCIHSIWGKEGVWILRTACGSIYGPGRYHSNSGK